MTQILVTVRTQLPQIRFPDSLHSWAPATLATSPCNTLFFYSSEILCASFKTNMIYGISKHHFSLLPLGFQSSLNQSIPWQLPPDYNYAFTLVCLSPTRL